MSLLTKYRPSDFDEVWGNDEVCDMLENVVTRSIEEIPNAFLFYGPSGCGKTTLARIVANGYLECSERDLMEVDTADYRGIDSVREIRKRMHIKPIGGQSRVYILDECHMLTNEAQNALLKALEDAPLHTFFMLCTTNPEKLLRTVRTRCESFQVELLDEDILLDGLKDICKAEKYKAPISILQKIVSIAEGSAREALSHLDKVLGMDAEDLEEYIEEIETNEAKTKDLAQALLHKKPWKLVAGIIKELTDEPESTRLMILGYMSTVILNESNKAKIARAYLVMDSFRETFFYTRKSGLVLACYEALYREE